MTTYASAAAVFDAAVSGELVPRRDLQWAHLEVCNLLLDHPGDRRLLDAEAGLSIWVEGGSLDLGEDGIERGHLLARHIAELMEPPDSPRLWSTPATR